MPDETSKPKLLNTQSVLLLIIIVALILMYIFPPDKGNNLKDALNEINNAKKELQNAQLNVANTKIIVDSLGAVFSNYKQFVDVMNSKVNELNSAHKQNMNDFNKLLSITQKDYDKKRKAVKDLLKVETPEITIETEH